jgi:aspartate racemase
MMEMKTVGLIGGLGPDTTAKFYLDIIQGYRSLRDQNYPSISIYNIPLSFEVEEEIVKYSKNEEKLLPYLIGAVRNLEKNSDFIALPCNTAHIFIDEIRKETTLPVLDIVEETAKYTKSMGYKKVGILATKKTIERRLYDDILEEMGVELIKPNPVECRIITEAIYSILCREDYSKNKKLLEGVISNLAEKGAEAVILGCTDLQLVVGQEDLKVPLLDSTQILVDAVLNGMSEK